MKELGNNLVQLVAVIMLMITLAVSTAALSQWASSDTSADGDRVEQADAATLAPSASVAP
jgi:hypothetical protein